MPLKICYENIVKIVCNYHFLKKKSGMELWQWHCRNRGVKKKFGNCGNPIVENGKEKKNGFRNLGRN